MASETKIIVSTKSAQNLTLVIDYQYFVFNIILCYTTFKGRIIYVMLNTKY